MGFGDGAKEFIFVPSSRRSVSRSRKRNGSVSTWFSLLSSLYLWVSRATVAAVVAAAVLMTTVTLHK